MLAWLAAGYRGLTRCHFAGIERLSVLSTLPLPAHLLAGPFLTITGFSDGDVLPRPLCTSGLCVCPPFPPAMLCYLTSAWKLEIGKSSLLTLSIFPQTQDLWYLFLTYRCTSHIVRLNLMSWAWDGTLGRGCSTEEKSV